MREIHSKTELEVVGVEDMGKPNKLPKHGLLWRRVICPLPHLPFPIQGSLLLAGLLPGSPIFQPVLILGVLEQLYSSQASKKRKTVWRRERCYSLLFQCCPQSHLSVFIDAKETNPMELGQFRQQYAEQWGCVDEEVSSIILGVEAG